MKQLKLLIPALCLVALGGCKSKIDKPKTDSIVIGNLTGTLVMKDSTGSVIDSSLSDGTYFIYNRKKVPMGIYKDEVVDTITETSSYISGAVFINRKMIYSISVVQPLTHYGDKRIWHFTKKINPQNKQ